MVTEGSTGRERVVIVDRDLDFGLKLADYLASSGYHAVLGRSLRAMMNDLTEMQPGAILLCSESTDHNLGAEEAEAVQAVKCLYPEAPVITLTKSAHDPSLKTFPRC